MDSALLKNMTERFIGALGIEVDEVSVSTGYRTMVAVSSSQDASKILIGPHGEHLRSINTLLRKLVEQQHGEDAATFLVDVNGYHEAQMEQVRQNARMLA